MFVNEESPDDVRSIANEAGIRALQLHGDESPDYCRELAADYYVIKTFAVSDTFDVEQRRRTTWKPSCSTLNTTDLRGGTGRVFDWSVAQQAALTIPKLFLAGGLSPENIENAVETVHPFAVDACSALEDTPGKKNHERMRVFVNTVRGVAP